MALAPHGERRVWTDGQVFFSENVGPFNLELVRETAAESREPRVRLSGSGPWGSVAVMHNSVMFTPEALDLIRENMKNMERNRNLVAAAFVVSPDAEGRLFCDKIFSEIYGLAGADFEVFEDVDEARAWVEERIAKSVGATARDGG